MYREDGYFWCDNSALTSVAACETQYAMEFVLGLRSKAAKVEAEAGRIGHKVIEAHHGGASVGACLDILDALYAPFAREQLLEDALAHSNFRDVMWVWLQRWPLERLPYVPLRSEQILNAPLVDDVMFYGLCDCEGQEKATGEVVPVDNKFRIGQINQWWTKKFGMASQQDGYCWLIEQVYQRPCSKAFINAIEVKKLPEPSKKKCASHKVPTEECRLMHAGSQHLIVARTQESLAEWRRAAEGYARRARDIYRWLIEGGSQVAWVKALMLGGKFSGACVFCEFAAWCRGGRQEGQARELFVSAPWTPWISR